MTDLSLYKGREQTAIKHEIFGKYLLRFACIVGGQWESITYVDCFSGPWKEKAADYSDTSFGIAIEHLKSARDAVYKTKDKKLKLRCFFVEKEADAYERLERHAAQHRGPDLDIVTFKGEFENAIPDIIKYVHAGGPHTFPFFFIDPTGWTGFAMDRLLPIFALPRVELMINFMTAFVSRFCKTDDSFADLFGFDVRPRLAELKGIDRDDAAVAAYMDTLRTRGKFDHVVPAIVLKPGEDKTHFHLIYATRHRKGLEVFKEAEKSAVGVMNKLRAEVKVERAEGPQELLFPAVDIDPSTMSHVESLRNRYKSQARERVRLLLLKKTEVPYDDAWAETVQWTPLTWESDLKDWIKAWQSSGQLEIPTLQPKKKVPTLNDGHRLRLAGTTLD